MFQFLTITGPMAFNIATYTINRLSSSSNKKHTPYEILFHEKPTYDELSVFGLLCYPWLKPYSSHKLAPKSSHCVFLGYSKLHKGYTCLKISSGPLFISRHVLFFEQEFPFKKLDDTGTTLMAEVSPTSISLPPILPLSNTPPGYPRSNSKTQLTNLF